MKKTLLLVLATALTAAPALAAVEVTGEAFVTHKTTLMGLTETAAKNAGMDIDRFRIFLSNKFNDQWSFKGAIEVKSDGASSVTIPEVYFLGTTLFMEKDSLRIGASLSSAYTFDSMGSRWITRSLMDEEGFMVAAISTGTTYKMGFGPLNVSLFSLSAESSNRADTDDNTKMNGALVDYKINDQFLVWAQGATVTPETVGTTVGAALGAAKSTALTSVGLNYRTEMVDAGFSYHTAAYTVESGALSLTTNSAMGVMAKFKKVAGSNVNLYAHYWTGYDKYAAATSTSAANAEDTESKMMIGPIFGLAEGKIDLGIFYQMETFQGDYKTAVPTAKEPSAAYVKLAAKF